jgi:precorrin-4/cobalt-precorrin-4 C11-methyltransferase
VCGGDCPAVVVYRASWPDQQIIRATLATLRAEIKRLGITRTALILVGRALASQDFDDSRLYAADHDHLLRPRPNRS